MGAKISACGILKHGVPLSDSVFLRVHRQRIARCIAPEGIAQRSCRLLWLIRVKYLLTKRSVGEVSAYFGSRRTYDKPRPGWLYRQPSYPTEKNVLS